MAGPTQDFWEQRFAAGDTPWDRGEANPQLGVWLDSGALKPCRILVPGCSSGYEVVALARAGFEVTALDYAPVAIERTRAQLAAAGQSATLVEADALTWQPVQPFDAVYEQTCLCALYPDQWRDYADQLPRWLVPGGRLYALFVQFPRPGAAAGAMAHRVGLAAYRIDRLPVTSAGFAAFLERHGARAPDAARYFDDDDADARIRLREGRWRADPGFERHPVVEAAWLGALAYCRSLGKRLPALPVPSQRRQGGSRPRTGTRHARRGARLGRRRVHRDAARAPGVAQPRGRAPQHRLSLRALSATQSP